VCVQCPHKALAPFTTNSLKSLPLWQEYIYEIKGVHNWEIRCYHWQLNNWDPEVSFDFFCSFNFSKAFFFFLISCSLKLNSSRTKFLGI